MLPIDQLTDAAKELLAANGMSESDILAALLLDKRDESLKGEVFLCLMAEEKRLLRLDLTENTIKEYSLTEYTHPYVDSYLSACRSEERRVRERV